MEEVKVCEQLEETRGAHPQEVMKGSANML
jgi:hypothetical protein